MKIQRYIYSLLVALLVSACEEVIEIDLNSSDPVVVAEGVITNDTTACLTLSYTSDYFALEGTQYIDGAVVNIVDDAGRSEALVAQGDGRYLASPGFMAQVGHSYTLSFTVGEQTYEASSRMMARTRILEVSFETVEAEMRQQIQGGESFSPTVVISDHPEEDNYYNFVFYVDDEKQEGFFLTTDRAAEEGKLSYSPFRMAIEGGGQVRVEVYSIDEATYTYYTHLDDLVGDMMDSSTPYNPLSNFGDDVMGFFSAYSSDVYVTSLDVEE